MHYSAQFGRESVLVSPSGFGNLVLTNVLFEIEFHKSQPTISHECRADTGSRLAVYGYNKALTPDHTVSSPYPAQILETPRMDYDSSNDGVAQSGGDWAVFSIKANPGHLVSALDFRQKFLRVQMLEELPVVFAEFAVKIGSRTVNVPMNQVTPDKCVGFSYRLSEF